MAPTTTLIHHDERSKIANTEFSAIFSFTGAGLSRGAGEKPRLSLVRKGKRGSLDLLLSQE
ncbi:hypothetical protein GCM10027195_04830 [Comamonas sediminis]